MGLSGRKVGHGKSMYILFARYREGKFKVEKRTYPDGASAKEIIDDIGIDIEKFPIGVLIVNGRHVGHHTYPKRSVIISLFFQK